MLEGDNITNFKYRVLTDVHSTYIKYFENGEYKQTSLNHCHWVINNNELIKIYYEDN